VSDWFKTAKDHVVGDRRRSDFRLWCYYEGTFALSTLYYTGIYFKCVHDIYAHSPFRELDSEYSSDAYSLAGALSCAGTVRCETTSHSPSERRYTRT
jgi:hypothetical protein